MHALPIMVVTLCTLAIAYRFYSAFIAARVLVLDDARITPAHRLADGKDFVPTNRWVLFGHHFAAITGAGPLIGPVLAAQFGFLPGLLWILVGVMLGGAVHDFVILTASVRRGGKSLAEIAREEIGPVAGIIAAIAIFFIVHHRHRRHGLRGGQHPGREPVGHLHHRHDHPHRARHGPGDARSRARRHPQRHRRSASSLLFVAVWGGRGVAASSLGALSDVLARRP